MKSVDQWLDEADGFLESERIDEYVRCRKEALKLDPRRPGVWIGLAEVLEEEDRTNEAVRALESGIAANPADAEIRFRLGCLLCSHDRHPEALPPLEQAIRLRPEEYLFAFRYAVALTAVDRDEEAVRACDRAIQIDPRRSQSYEMKATCLASLGREAEAVSAYTLFMAVADQFADPEGYGFALGYCQKMDPKKRIMTVLPESFEKTRRHNEFVRLAMRHVEARQYPECIVACAAVLEQDPGHAAAMALKAWGLRRVDPPELDESDELLRKASLLEPANSYVQQALDAADEEDSGD